MLPAGSNAESRELERRGYLAAFFPTEIPKFPHIQFLPQKQGRAGSNGRIKGHVRTVKVGKPQFGHQGEAIHPPLNVSGVCVKKRIVRVVFVVGVVHHGADPKPFGQPIMVVERENRGGAERKGQSVIWINFVSCLTVIEEFMQVHPDEESKRITDFETNFVSVVHPVESAPVRLRLHPLPMLVEALDISDLEIEVVVPLACFGRFILAGSRNPPTYTLVRCGKVQPGSEAQVIVVV